MKHHMTAELAAALDLETPMRLYPHGRIGWTNVRFTRDMQGVVLRRLVEWPSGRWGLAVREMQVRPDAMLEVDANAEAEAIIQDHMQGFLVQRSGKSRAHLRMHVDTVVWELECEI